VTFEEEKKKADYDSEESESNEKYEDNMNEEFQVIGEEIVRF
jgi:hypothetical protein